MDHRILAINPRLRTTNIALYENNRSILEKTIEVEPYMNNEKNLTKQAAEQKNCILKELHQEGINLSSIDAIVGRGGLLRPIPGGTYEVNNLMLHDLETEYNGSHPSNLGGIIAHYIAKQLCIRAFIVDPVVVDELEDHARMTGIPDIQRKSIFHALSQKAAARKVAKQLGIEYEEAKLIVVHLGGGISVGAHKFGKVIDVNNGLHGDGPLAPERAGTLPAGDLISLSFSQVFSKTELMDQVSKTGGLKAYLGTSDLNKIEQDIQEGNAEAKLVYDVMAYQISKEIGALATTMDGYVDAIVLTGMFDDDGLLKKTITNRVKWIADVFVYPGENILESLAEGALRVMTEVEQVKRYEEFILREEQTHEE